MVRYRFFPPSPGFPSAYRRKVEDDLFRPSFPSESGSPFFLRAVPRAETGSSPPLHKGQPKCGTETLPLGLTRSYDTISPPLLLGRATSFFFARSPDEKTQAPWALARGHAPPVDLPFPFFLCWLALPLLFSSSLLGRRPLFPPRRRGRARSRLLIIPAHSRFPFLADSFLFKRPRAPRAPSRSA